MQSLKNRMINLIFGAKHFNLIAKFCKKLKFVVKSVI